jgi:KaiC/GvpD/RAD55 family RecA-like ATPase
MENNRRPSRIPTGIPGLDELLGGGYVKNTVNTLIGTTGTGKTIFSIQFLLEGLERGEDCIYISFDLEKEDFERVTESLGWKVADYIESEQLKVMKFHVEDTSFLNSGIMKTLGQLAESAKHEHEVRIAIDSFTPLITTIDERARADVGWFFRNLRTAGTAVITLEEPFDGRINSSLEIPAFLSDCVIHLKNIGYGEIYSRTLRIVKHRFSWHNEGVFPYSIVEGIGVVVENKRFEGFKVDVSKLRVSEFAKTKILKLAEEGIISEKDIEKIIKRIL